MANVESEVNPSHSKQIRPLVIFGSGGHAVSVANVAISAGFTVKHFVDKNKLMQHLVGVSIISDLSELQDLESHLFGIAVGDNGVREQIYNDLKRNYQNLSFPPLIHSSAIVSSFTSIGEGTVLMPNAIVGPNTKVGKFCIINTQALIDHDSLMLDFSSLAPAVATGGGVTIGLRSAISIGAIIKHGLKIGDDSIVGANSYLNKDLPSKKIAYGTPAKQIRNRCIDN